MASLARRLRCADDPAEPLLGFEHADGGSAQAHVAPSPAGIALTFTRPDAVAQVARVPAGRGRRGRAARPPRPRSRFRTLGGAMTVIKWRGQLGLRDYLVSAYMA